MDYQRGAVEARHALERLGVKAEAVRLIKSAHNQHWLVRQPEGRAILRRYGRGRTRADVDFELRLLDRLDRSGWPVPVAETKPVEFAGHLWCVFRYLPGRNPSPRTAEGTKSEQRSRGALLAHLHSDTRDFVDLGQREGWVRSEEVLGDRVDGPQLDRLLDALAIRKPDEARVLRWHADRVDELFTELDAASQPSIVIHGDFAPWNLRFRRGRLSGVFDFDLSHLDQRVADFALSWRGKHDEVVRGYHEVDPLSPVETELITPAWWAWLLEGARKQLLREIDTNLDWVLGHITRRSPLMPDRFLSPALGSPH